MHAFSLGPRGRSAFIVFLLLAASPAVLVTLAPNAGAAAPSYAWGHLCTNTWSSGATWIINATAVVDAGCVLTIQPGVTVMADPSVHLYVNGTLTADGLSGNPILFVNNQTASITPWAGIQFDKNSDGSVSWARFTRVQIALMARSSSPAINNNTIVLASAGVYLDKSSSRVADNTVDGERLGSYGIFLDGSNAPLARNRINGTAFGIQANGGGNLTATGNVITNVSGTIAIGIYVDNLTSASLSENVIQAVVGAPGGTGMRGGTGVGVLVNGTATATITGNTIETVRGGRGGDGANSAVLSGSAGGAGGAAAGIALGAVKEASLQDNVIANVSGNRGGAGGSSTIAGGGEGGAGGIAFALELFSSTGNVSYLGNRIINVTGGEGGGGGTGSTGSNGNGGAGADAYGVFSAGGQNASISGNTVQHLTGGAGGGSPTGNGLPGTGGSGGNSTAIVAVINGFVTIHADSVDNVTGGSGGNGHAYGGSGGDATGILAVGTGAAFNQTTATFNRVTNVTGGTGGVGGKVSGRGGNATGIGGLHADLSLVSNFISTIQGGNGGPYGVITNPASGGGSATAAGFLLVPDGSSSQDTFETITPGSAGGSVSPPASYGVGVYFAGDTSTGTHVTVTNGTITSASSYALYVDNYTDVTTLNTAFSQSKVAVMSAGNLTVQNFLTVRVLWPNGITPVWASWVAVKDNGIEFYNRTAPLGVADWVVVTNRVYVDSPVPLWNATQVRVGYQSYSFADNPRVVNLTASQTQSFTMNDTTPPWSAALALSHWTATRTFTVGFDSNDGFGVGVANVTLWYRFNGAAWVAYNTTSSALLGFGQFTFTASSDGTYEFATTAYDNAGNEQQPSPPTANNTWTIVDTIAPATRVLTLPAYETAATFTVNWGPDNGVTDVANYTIQANTGSGWVNWLVNTTATSASYASTAQGPVAFRSVARDFAGNLESKAGNDTWTVVDTIAPQVVSHSPTGNLTASPSTIVVTFSEPMDTASVQAALQISPSVNGTFAWTNGSRTLTITLPSSLALGTTYTVTVGTGAKDLAGNPLAQASVFTFATPPPPGLSLMDLWPLLVLAAVVAAGIAVFLVRRRTAATPETPETVTEPPKPAPPASPAATEAAIDDIFLLYRSDGVLIKHETRRLRPDIDSDILSGMLNAVQAFVKDSLLGTEGDELNEMVLGQMHILIGRGKWLILAATITGGDMTSMTTQIQKCIQDMEDHNWDRLEDWDGDMDLAKVLGPYLKKLIRGEYGA